MQKKISFEHTMKSGVTENIDFMLKMRSVIFSYYQGKTKNFLATFEYIEGGQNISMDMTADMTEFLAFLASTIDASLSTVEKEIAVKEGYIKNILDESESHMIIKLHLIVQSLLWRYIQIKIRATPKQSENWSFQQVVDLADAFNEIPNRITSYFGTLNTLRNNIAHKPFALKFSNIKRKYSAALYSRNGSLSGLAVEPHTDSEILQDWKSTFLIAAVILGHLIDVLE